MKQIVSKWQGLPPSDQLFLVIRAAQLTSDVKVFQRLLSLLDDVITSSMPTLNQVEIQARMETCNGTDLEPFTLNKRNLLLGSRLAQLAYSRRHAQKRFRVVSEESIGSRGGLVLGIEGKNQYLERFMRKDYSFNYRDCWYWAPSTPAPSQLLDLAIHTHIEATIQTSAKSAFLLKVDVNLQSGLANSGVFRAPGAEELLAWSHGMFVASVVNGETTTPLDLQVDFQTAPKGKLIPFSNRLLIKPTSPESIMRFSALLASRAVLQIDSKYGGPGKAQLEIQLSLPEKKLTKLATEIRRIKPLFEDICLVPHNVPLPLDSKDIAAVLSELSPKDLTNLKESKAA